MSIKEPTLKAPVVWRSWYVSFYDNLGGTLCQSVCNPTETGPFKATKIEALDYAIEEKREKIKAEQEAIFRLEQIRGNCKIEQMQVNGEL